MHDRDMTRGQPKIYYPKRVIQHPNFDIKGSGYPYDIGLVELREDAQLNKYVSIVALAESGESVVGNPDCWVSGWGRTDWGDDFARILKVGFNKTEYLQHLIFLF